LTEVTFLLDISLNFNNCKNVIKVTVVDIYADSKAVEQNWSDTELTWWDKNILQLVWLRCGSCVSL